MAYEVVFTNEAEETFDLIVNQLFENWGVKTVIKFQELTSIYIDKIAENPLIYPIVENNNEIRKCILHANCSILFYISSDKIIIICFWDNRQEPIFL